MRRKCVLNSDLLDIIGDYAGSEFFFLKFTLTPKRGYVSKIMVVSRNYKYPMNRNYFRVLNTPYGKPHWKPISRLKNSHKPRKLKVSHWKPISRLNSLPDGKKLLALGIKMWGVNDKLVKQLTEVTDFVLQIY